MVVFFLTMLFAKLAFLDFFAHNGQPLPGILVLLFIDILNELPHFAQRHQTILLECGKNISGDNHLFFS